MERDLFQEAGIEFTPTVGRDLFEEAGIKFEPAIRNPLAVANDTVIEAANAIAGGVGSVANFVSPGNRVSRFIDENIVKPGEQSQSDAVKMAKQRFRSDIASADGLMDEAKIAAKYAVSNPLLSAAQAAGSFALPLGAVKTAGAGAKALGAGASTTQKAALGGGAAAGAALSGGDAAGTAYELSKQGGASEEQAVEAARQASAIPALVGAAGGLVGAERLVAGAKGFTGNVASRALKTGAVEATQEGFEEGITQYEGQRAAVPYNPGLDPMKGVGAAATTGAILGAATGGTMAALTPPNAVSFTPPNSPTAQAGLPEIVVPIVPNKEQQTDVSTRDALGPLVAEGGQSIGDQPSPSVGAERFGADAGGGGLGGSPGGVVGLGEQAAPVRDTTSEQAAPVERTQTPLVRASDADLLARVTAQVEQAQPGQSQPVTIWTGRAGDGYADMEAAQAGLQTRIKREPELRWEVEQMPSGKYRLAGYEQGNSSATLTSSSEQPSQTIQPEIKQDSFDTSPQPVQNPANFEQVRQDATPATPAPKPLDMRLIPMSKRAEYAASIGQAEQPAPQPAPQAPALTDKPDGTLAVTGDPKALKQQLINAGIPSQSIMKSKTGVLIGRSQVDKVREFFAPQNVQSSIDGANAQRDTGSYGPATQAHRDAAVKLARAISGRIEGRPTNDLLDAVTPGGGDRGRAANTVSSVARRIFSREVVYVKFKGDQKFNGAVSRSVPGYIFVNIDSQKPLMAVLGHELTHELEKSQPGVYADLSRSLGALLKNESAYTNRLLANYKRQGISTDGLKAKQELEADIVGDNFMDPEFWQALAQEQPSLFRRIADAVIKWLDEIAKKIGVQRPFGTDQFLTDIAAAREAVATAMRQFSGAEVGAVTDGADGDVKLSVARGKTDAMPESTAPGPQGDERSGAKQGNAVTSSPRSVPVRKSLLPGVVVEGGKPVVLHSGVGYESEAQILSKWINEQQRPKPEPGVFYRFTNNKDEPSLARRGELRASKNHRDNFAETGVSVADAPHYSITGYKYGYIVDGDVVGEGSDGEFLLDPKTIKVKSNIRSAVDIALEGKKRIESSKENFWATSGLSQQFREAWQSGSVFLYPEEANNEQLKEFLVREALNSRGPFSKGGLVFGRTRLEAEKLVSEFLSNESTTPTSDGVTRFSIAEDTIEVDGIQRPRTNSKGQPIHSTEDGIRNFWRWFSNSKVVDAEGRPLVVYHGTTKDFEAFDNAKTASNDMGLWGRGHYFASNPESASNYALRQGDDAHVIPVYVSIQSPLKLRTGKDLVTRLPDGTNTRELIGKNLDGAKIKAIAINGGHDGVIQLKPDSLIGDVVAFRPEQIKSATGNQGTFDPASADIRFSVQAPQGQRFTLPEDGATAITRIKLQDDALRMKRVIDAVKEQGGTVGEEQNFYDANTLMPGRVQSMMDSFRDDAILPMLKKAAKADISMDELSLYAYARHAEERNAYIASINPKMQDGGSGMTNADAQAILAEFQKGGKAAEYEDLHADLMGIAATTRRTMLDEGLITQEQYDAMESQYENYIPLRGFENVDAETGAVRPGTGRGINVRGKETIRALGRRSRAGDLIENVIRDYQRAVVKAEKNNVAKVLLDFVLSNPDPDLWGVDVEKGKATLNKATGQVEYATTIDKGEDTIGVKVGGQQVYIKIEDKSLARALRHAWKDETGDLERAAVVVSGWYNTLLRNVLTRYNPPFALVNTIRDAQSGAVAALDELGAKGAKRFAFYYPKAVAASYRGERGWGRSLFQNPVMDKYFEEFKNSGAITGGFFMKDLGDIASDMRTDMLQYGAAPKNLSERARASIPWFVGSKVLRALEFMGSVSENTTRFALYMAARDSGRTPSEAALLAKNGTTNFNRKGEWGGTLNALYLFFNAAVQGNAQLFKTLKNPKVRAALSVVAGVGVAAAVFGASGGGEDDDGQAYWDKIPDYEKERNLIIMLPPGETLGNGVDRVGKYGRYIKVPVQYGLNFFPNMGYMMADVYRNQQDPTKGKTIAKATKHMLSVTFGSVNPFGGALDVTDSVSVAMALAPTILDLPIMLGTERNSFGSPVAPSKFPGDTKPDSERMFASDIDTVPANIAKALNEMGGGNEVKPGKILGVETSVTPGTIENLIRATTGGLGMFGVQSWDVAAGLLGDDGVRRKGLEPANWPALNKVYGEVGANQNIRLAGERMREVRDVSKLIDDQLKSGIAPEISDDERKIFALSTVQETYQKEMNRLRKEEVAVLRSEEMTNEKKRLALDNIKAAQDALSAAVNRAYLKQLGPVKKGELEVSVTP